MDPQHLLAHLADICEDLDTGRPLHRPTFALPAASLLLMGVALTPGCGDKPEPAYMAPMETGSDTAVLYAAPMEDCDDGSDNDDDTFVDCDDLDCAADTACSGGENCTNGVDDDGDTLADCDDPDCLTHEACTDVPAYAAPMG